LAFEGDLADGASERALWDAATALLPEAGGIAAYTQGMMDVGATLCRVRAPHCLLCPAQPVCAAAREGTQERYPRKSRRLVRSRPRLTATRSRRSSREGGERQCDGSLTRSSDSTTSSRSSGSASVISRCRTSSGNCRISHQRFATQPAESSRCGSRKGCEPC